MDGLFRNFDARWFGAGAQTPRGMLTLSIETPVVRHKILARIPLHPTIAGIMGGGPEGTLTRMGWSLFTWPRTAGQIAIEVKVQEIKLQEGCSAYLFAVRWADYMGWNIPFTYQLLALRRGIPRRPTVGETNDDVLQDQFILAQSRGIRFTVYILNRRDVDLRQFIDLMERGIDRREAYTQWR
ncbi:hypothetical protein MMC14_009252 [Varicellaria rhodocarpa]|nr:hypothetical protein [Varicellaria rhodocarpa]